MFTIKVKNFQAAESAELEVSGLTVLTGQNNGGKSVMVRAFQALFTNASVKSFVRKGEKSLSVEVLFDDGNHLLWEKGGNLNRYTINGKELTSVGAGVPDEVAALGVVPIDAGGHTLWPQISAPLEGPLFLLDKTGPVFAEAVSDTERVGLLAEATRRAESDIRSDKAELKVRQRDLLAVSANLDRFILLDSLHPKVERIKEIEAEIARTISGYDKVSAWQATREKSLITLSKIDFSEVFLPDIPRIDTIISVQANHDRMVKLRAILSKIHSVDVPEVPPFDLGIFQSLKNRLESSRRLCIGEIPDLPSLSRLEKINSYVDMVQRFVLALQEVTQCLDESKVLEAEIPRIDKMITAISLEMDERQGICPECGRPYYD